MANATAPVNSRLHRFASETWFYYPIKNTAQTYWTGAMMGRDSTGYAVKFDDTAALSFLGVFAEHNLVMDGTGSNGDRSVRIDPGRLLEMPLTGSETASRLTDIGRPVYAVYDKEVTKLASGTTYANLVGYIEDIINAATGTSSLTGTRVLIRPVTAREAASGLNAPIERLTLTALGTSQSSSPTAAQLLGGFLTQTGATGAGAVTLPSGTAVSAAFPRTPAVGDTFRVVFANLGGGQTLTITGATGTTVISGGAIATAKTAILTFINTGANAWSIAVAGG